MRIAVAQINPVVGDFEGNFKKVSQAFERACQAGVDLVLTPELSLLGYPAHDLMDRPEVFSNCEALLNRLEKLSTGKKTALLVGYAEKNTKPFGRGAKNSIAIFQNGKRVFSQTKVLLPTYDVFDEARYFEPGDDPQVWIAPTGKRVAIAICEDLWSRDTVHGRRLYNREPGVILKRQDPEILISISASPYEYGKRSNRESLHQAWAKEMGVPFVYINQTGATDEVMFDGSSFASTKTGEFAGRLKSFQPAFGVFDTETQAWEPGSELGAPDESEMDRLVDGLIDGIRSYFTRTGFKKAVLGLSGGVDSALVGALAVQALGRENVRGVAMPSQYSSSHSLEDAEILARNLGIAFEVRPIKFIFSTLARDFNQGSDLKLTGLAEENLQSRLRGLILMSISNSDGSLVLTTGNKSEIAMGYCTLYGDMCGALAPIGDLYKTRVYDVCQVVNARFGSPIPERTLTKAPSAELRPDQKDQDTLPPYADLDRVLEAYIERFDSVEDLVTREGAWVRDILRKLEMNEYKRRQGAPALKISSRAFGLGRRVPLAKRWDL